jgi:hypothetical protein
VLQVVPDLKEHKEILVLKAFLDPKASLVLKEHREIKARRDHKVQLVS